ncbi:hypothetical protein N665_0366s0002 [Sinapis alba]|nr:hypothetical protein N665_0366s0002 [Sinapis alba]
MDLKSSSSSINRNKGYGGRQFCACRLPAKEGGNKHCSYFEWLDEEEVNGWPKRALIEARDEIREKKKWISELTATVNFLRMELEQQKVEKPGCSNGDDENICNEFVKLLNKGNFH